MWANFQSPAAWDPSEWEIKSKVGKDLANHPFANIMREYADWSANMLNHLLRCNQGYGKVIHFVQKDKQPITYERLSRPRAGISGRFGLDRACALVIHI